MELIYFDDKIIEYEEKLDFINSIKYLENLFIENKDILILNSLAFNSWFYYIEGDVNQIPLTYDWKYFHGIWKKYIDFGIEIHLNDDSFCLIAGYTLLLGSMHLGNEYEGKGLKLIQQVHNRNGDSSLGILATFFLRKSAKEFTKWNELFQLKMILFNNQSISAKYFNEIIKK